MNIELLTEHHLEFLSLKGGCTCSSDSTLVKMPHCWKSRVTAVVMGVTLGTGTFKPEKNLVFFRIKSPGPHRCHPGKLE